MKTQEIIQADYTNSRHAQAIVTLMDHCAQDATSGGSPLPEHVTKNLIKKLACFPTAISLICYDHGEPVGLLNGFEGFSTFQAASLLNIHDLIVRHDMRGKGIGKKLIAEIECIAQARNYCKITLEVLDGNHNAKQVYLKFGFVPFQLNATHGKAMFWHKLLSKNTSP